MSDGYIDECPDAFMPARKASAVLRQIEKALENSCAKHIVRSSAAAVALLQAVGRFTTEAWCGQSLTNAINRGCMRKSG